MRSATEPRLQVGTLLAKARFNRAWTQCHPRDKGVAEALASAERMEEKARAIVEAEEKAGKGWRS